MKRFISLFVVVVLSFSICTFAFALEDLPEFDSDFVRYAPSSGSLTVGSDSVSVVVPWIVHSSSGSKSVRGLSAQCHAIGSQHGHFTFVIIVGSINNPSLLSNPQPVNIETIDSSSNLHYYSSYLRPTNYRFNYSHRVSDIEVKNFSCIPFIVEFDIPEGETFTEIYQTNNQTFISVSGEYVTSAFFLYSATKNSSLDHLQEIGDYLSIVSSYIEQLDYYLNGLLGVTDNIYRRVDTINYFLNNINSRYNTSISKNATWDNMPETNNVYYLLADILNATVNEKSRKAQQEDELEDLKYLQQTVISNTAEQTYTFYQGITNIFDFFDTRSSSTSFDISDSFLGYEDYFGNVPFFFSSDIESRLEVQ